MGGERGRSQHGPSITQPAEPFRRHDRFESFSTASLDLTYMPSLADETKALPLLAAYPFATGHGLASDAERIRTLATNSSVRRGHFVQLFRAHSLLDEFIRQHW